MAERKAHRMASRRGERLRRQRRAKAADTCFAERERILPGCEKAIICKIIKNSEARFNNRKRDEGWLTPTANHLLACHLSLLKKTQQILPISKVVLEINSFAFMAMDNPNIQRWQYQRGLSTVRAVWRMPCLYPRTANASSVIVASSTSITLSRNQRAAATLFPTLSDSANPTTDWFIPTANGLLSYLKRNWNEQKIWCA